MTHLKLFGAIFFTLSLFSDLTTTDVAPRNSKNINGEYSPTSDQTTNVEIPESFDAREKWPFCESIGKIRDQQNCNAGWAFATAEVMTDRLCIQNNGSVKVEFSPQDLLSCCKECGGCNAGEVAKAWLYWSEHGTVSGGDNNGLYEGCIPYSQSTALDIQIPPCQKRCQDGYPFSYEEDLYFADFFYFIRGDGDNLDIQVDIMTRGPVQAGFIITEDFYRYKNGVYIPDPNAGFMGYTNVKLLGWGVEDGTPYWLAALSWGDNWGGLNGFFKILRGENAAGIEDTVMAAVVKLDRLSDSTSTVTFPAITPPSTTPSVSVRSTMSWPVVCTTFYLVFVRFWYVFL